MRRLGPDGAKGAAHGAYERHDLHHVVGVRRVDSLAVADVYTREPEPIEHDALAGRVLTETATQDGKGFIRTTAMSGRHDGARCGHAGWSSGRDPWRGSRTWRRCP